MTEEQFPLTEDQQRIFDVVTNTRNNFLITGKPGVGKSVLIRALVQHSQKHFSLAAPTGLAALNIDGKTLHSIFRIPVSQGLFHPEFNKFSLDDRVIANIKYNIKHLIIDECSMVRCDVFDYIDRLCRFVKEKDEPFGGIQIILVGDFFQLAPIVQREEKTQLKEYGYDSPFIFDSKVWAQGNFQIEPLTEVLRQKGDNGFIKFLHKARTGELKTKDLEPINKQVQQLEDLRINLTSTNKESDDINSYHLRSIDSEEVVYEASKYGDWPANPVEPILKLKVGAQVMVRMNRADQPPNERVKGSESKVVNGSLGVVKEFGETNDKTPFVKITLENEEEVNIYRKRWERKIKTKNSEGQWEEQVVASFEQIPLSLAWAISMHKSQGQTFEKVHINAARIFAPGQLYVALSRCKTMKGISLEARLTTNKFFSDHNVIRFYNNLNVEV